ncbi:MAG: DHA2 family efflux MFS transporter permease subunit [Caulobacter sp.]|nr:DHA2 family efflux MFS transporter permease subunit [Caulobacter sp.]
MTVATLTGPETPPKAAEDPPAVNWPMLFLGFGGMAIGQFMAILDIQVVAASLPQIQAGVGASADQVSWIQTAYLIPEVVMIPLSAYLSRLWGTQKVFMASCAGFVFMSVMAGLSTSIDMLILCRALQGFVGGAMVPTVFATAFSAFPPERRITANVVTGMIVTLAPTVGPTLGGHLTEWLNWRWLFFINVAPGLLSLFLVGRWGNFDQGDRRLGKNFDWTGLALMAAFLMSMQYVVEEGSKNNWFEDDAILWLTVLAVVTGASFIWRQITHLQPIVQVKAFADRNFTLGVIMTSVSGAALYGGTFLMPLYLGRIRHFSAAEVGTTMLVSGLAMFVTGPITGRWLRQIDPRGPMIIGFCMVAWGMWMGHAITDNWGFWEFAGLQVFRGVGVMVAMIATTQMTMSTLPQNMVKDASGMVNLARNVGGAIGMAMLSTTLSTRAAVHMGEISARVSIASVEAQTMLAGLTARMQQLGVADPDAAARKAFQYMISQKAQVLAFGDSFALLAIGGACAAVMAMLTSPTRVPPGGGALQSEVH